jgi:rod shape determining protein RodA
VLVLLDPMRDPLGRGYHIIQATIALGSGGARQGMAERHADPSGLPARMRHTDFIFAVYGEGSDCWAGSSC